MPDHRATLPPPMPEQEYIEKILATEEAASKPRQRLNTLIERDPLQYDASAVPADENTRPTKPPGSAVAAGGGGDDFLDLSLGELSGDRASAPEVTVAPKGAAIPPPAPLRPSLDSFDDLPIGDVLESISPDSMSGRAISIAPPGSVRPAPGRPPLATRPPAPPPPRRAYDSSPTIEVVEVGSIPISPTPGPVQPVAASPTPSAAAPGAVDARAKKGAGDTEKNRATAPAQAASKAGVSPAPSGVIAKPSGARTASSRSTKAAATAAPSQGTIPPMSSAVTPARGTAVGPSMRGPLSKVPSTKATPAGGTAAPLAPSAVTPAQGTAAQAMSSKATPARGTSAEALAGAKGAASGRPPQGAVTPAAGTKGPHLGSGPPGARTTDRPTRALRSPLTAEALAPAVEKVVERFEAGDFGRALMLAEQAIESGNKHEDLQHYAELCREKLRQRYLERIGTGRTILRVMVDPEKLRERALDPRLAFLLSLLDGASTIDDVVDMSTMPPLEAVRALHELLQEGVVEVVEAGRRLSVQ